MYSVISVVHCVYLNSNYRNAKFSQLFNPFSLLINVNRRYGKSVFSGC